jgi:hypothetical protein
MHDNIINEYLQLLQETSFPYPQYTEKELNNSYCKLQEKYLTKTSNVGLELVKQFHPSIWRCNINNRPSPIDAWQDEDIMTKVIANRLKYLKTDTLSLNNLLTGLSVTKLAPKVSIFRPAMAKYLIQKYLSEFCTIFDPCAGFSGRMLGACSLNKKYIGQDINSVTMIEASRLADFLKLDVCLSNKDSLYDSGNYECLFTCPPYGNKENWCQDIEELSADEWIEACLQNYKCKRYLFVIDKTEKYQQYIVEELQHKAHFSTAKELVILIDR